MKKYYLMAVICLVSTCISCENEECSVEVADTLQEEQSVDEYYVPFEKALAEVETLF